MVLPELTSKQYKVQEQDATSYEFYVALALDRLKLPYMFQYQILGGRVRRGGIILDFLVLVPPLSIPLLVHGNYWHRDEMSTQDKLEESIIRQMPEFGELIILWGTDVNTPEKAYASVKSAFKK